VIALALPAAAVVVRETREPAGRPPDVAGTILAAALLGTLTYALIAAEPRAALVAGALLAAFVAVERRHPSPMLPLRLFRRPAFAGAATVAGTMNLGSNGTLFVLTLFLQDVRGRTPVQAGVALLPAFGMLSVLAPAAGRIVGRLGPRPAVVAGLLCSAAGLALLVEGPLVVACLLWGAGLGLLTPAVVAASMGAVERDRSGLASAVNNTARQTGNAIGVAAAGSVAGSPAAPGFVHGFHGVALGAAALYLLAAGLALVALRPSVGRKTRRRRWAACAG
jgi:MFS transporter, DHA2 family, methylenomycin A resistance protein